MLPWNEAEPSGEVAAAAERFERRREGFDCQGRDRPDARMVCKRRASLLCAAKSLIRRSKP
jgi:hypothetical protein